MRFRKGRYKHYVEEVRHGGSMVSWWCDSRWGGMFWRGVSSKFGHWCLGRGSHVLDLDVCFLYWFEEQFVSSRYQRVDWLESVLSSPWIFAHISLYEKQSSVGVDVCPQTIRPDMSRALTWLPVSHSILASTFMKSDSMTAVALQLWVIPLNVFSVELAYVTRHGVGGPRAVHQELSNRDLCVLVWRWSRYFVFLSQWCWIRLFSLPSRWVGWWVIFIRNYSTRSRQRHFSICLGIV